MNIHVVRNSPDSNFSKPQKLHYARSRCTPFSQTTVQRCCVEEKADVLGFILKFIYSEKAIKFCEISTLLLSYVVSVKSNVEILQNFVAFSEYMNFNII